MVEKDLHWGDEKLTAELWLSHAEDAIKKGDPDVNLPIYHEIEKALICSCPNLSDHEDSKESTSPLLPCWFVDPRLKYKFGLIYLLKTIPITKNAWFLKYQFNWDNLWAYHKTPSQGLDDMSSYMYDRLDVTKEDQEVKIFLAMLDLANLLRLWDWKLSSKNIMALITSEWAIFDQHKEHLPANKNATYFLHPIDDLPLAIRQIRVFIQSLVLDLVTISIETRDSILSHLPHLIGQALGPLWNLIRPWEEFVHAHNFLSNFECFFEHLMSVNRHKEVPSIHPPDFKTGQGFYVSRNIHMDKKAHRCTICSKNDCISLPMFASCSKATFLYPRKILVSDPGEPAEFAVTCSYQCHATFGDHFKYLTWTDKPSQKEDATSLKIQTNASMFFHIPKRPKHQFPPIVHEPFLSNMDLSFPKDAKPSISLRSYRNLITQANKSKTSDNLPFIVEKSNEKLRSIPSRRNVFEGELSYLEDTFNQLEDVGSIRCFLPKSWLPGATLQSRSIRDVFVISYPGQDQPDNSTILKREKERQILELLLLEREFIVYPITSAFVEARDVKIGVHFHLRKPKYRNNFTSECLQRGLWYIFARRLDLETRNCIGGFLIPSSSQADSWMGILVPDLFDRVHHEWGMQTRFQSLSMFQEDPAIENSAKASPTPSNESRPQREIKDVKKVLLFSVGAMLHRLACESSLPPRLNFEVRMIPFKLVMPNIDAVDCTVILNFLFMMGDPFLYVIQHIHQKLRCDHVIDFSIVDDETGRVVAETDIIPKRWFQGSLCKGYTIDLQICSLSQDMNMGRCNIISTDKTKIVFDGELLLFRIQLLQDFYPGRSLLGIATPDQSLSLIVQNISRWHLSEISYSKSILYYFNGKDVPINMKHLLKSTLETIAKVVGHVGSHFSFCLLRREDPLSIPSIFPQFPFPLFSRCHSNDLMFNDNEEVLMWKGDVIITGNFLPRKTTAWICTKSADLRKPKTLQTFFGSLRSKTVAYIIPFNEMLQQNLRKHSSKFSLVVAPAWFESLNQPNRNWLMDRSYPWLIHLFPDSDEYKHAVMVPFDGPKSRFGIIIKEDNSIGFRFYVPHDPSWIQRLYAPMFDLKISNQLETSPAAFSFEFQKKCHILGIFNVTQNLRRKCARPIFMVARTFNPNITTLGDLAPKEKVDGVVGSHCLLSISKKLIGMIPDLQIGLIGFLLNSKIATIQGRYRNCGEIIVDLFMATPQDIIASLKSLALFLFRGTLNELKQLALKNDGETIVRRSLFLKLAEEDFALGFLFTQDIQLEIVQALMPLFLANYPPCECFRCGNKIEIISNREEKEVQLLWQQNDEREQCHRNLTKAKSDDHKTTFLSKNDSNYPGMLDLFTEERTRAQESKEAFTKYIHSFEPLTGFQARGQEVKDYQTNTDAIQLLHKESVQNQGIDREIRTKTEKVDPADPFGAFKHENDNMTEESLGPITSNIRPENDNKPIHRDGTLGRNVSPPREENQEVWKPLKSFIQRSTSQEGRNGVLKEMTRQMWKESVGIKEPLRVCDSCGLEAFDIKVCSTCKASFFCNDKCFKKVQRNHKSLCSQIVNLRFELSCEPLKCIFSLKS